MTIFYIKNTETGDIISIEAATYGSLSKNFRNSPYEQCSESEITAQELKEAQDAKVAICKSYLTSTDWQALANITRQRPYDIGVEDNRLFATDSQNIIESYADITDVSNYDITQLTN